MISIRVRYDELATGHVDSRSILCGILVRNAYLEKTTAIAKVDYNALVQRAFDFGQTVESIACQFSIPLEVLKLEYESESLLELSADTVFVEYAHLFSDIHAALSDPENPELILGFALFLVSSGFFVPYLGGEFNESRSEPYEEYLINAAYAEAGFTASTLVNVIFKSTAKWEEFRKFQSELLGSNC